MKCLIVLCIFFCAATAAKTKIQQPLTPRTQPSQAQQPVNNVDWEEDEYVPIKVDGKNAFDWKLVKAVMNEDKSNVFMSPFSVKLLLTLLLEASAPGTQTQRELSTTNPNLNANAPFQIRDSYLRALTSFRNKSEHYDLDFGTRIFIDNSIEPRQRFSSICEVYYDAKITRVDYAKPNEAAATINEWCAQATRDNIKTIVNEDNLSSAVVVMLNAVYFKGLWTKPFEENLVPGQFFTQQGAVPTQFMTLKDDFYFHDSSNLNALFLRLPYRGRKFSMIIVLPKDVNGIDQLIDQLDSTNLNRALWYMDPTEVNILMPKFKFEYTSHLNGPIESLGIRDIFTNDASLPSFARGEKVEGRLKVSNILQKAGISVDEKGSTAYAATEVDIVNKFGGSGTKDFKADHPFLFFIEDETVGNLLFVGKVANPV